MSRPTLPDLVLLCLLSERAWHGYELNAELERRHVEEWAGVSRPQVYYSLKKLAAQGWAEPVKDETRSGGPERQTYRTSPLGTTLLQEALGESGWAEHRTPPRFLTWLALSPYADDNAKRRVIDARERFLCSSIERERSDLASILADEGAAVLVGEMMVRLMIAEFETELTWLAEVRRRLLGEGDHQA